MMFAQQIAALSNHTLASKAPSIFATEPWDGVSDKYTFVPTIDIIERLRAEANLVPITARQSRTRWGSGKNGYQKHEVRLVDARALTQGVRNVGDAYPTVNLTNSHDTGAALAIDAGLFRLVCANGMMVPDNLAQSVRVRHTGDLGEVIDGVFSVVEESQNLLELVEEYRGIVVPKDAQVAFATAALELRESSLPVTAEQLLRPRRYEDRSAQDYSLPKPDLWTTVNVVQESLVRGGQVSKSSTGRRMRTRAIADIAQDQKLNKALFVLAEQLKQQLG